MRRILTQCAWVAVGLLGAQVKAALAGDDSQGNSPNRTARAVVSSMDDRDGLGTPYAVRFKITGFLARQHAREGDIKQALAEFHSMLSADDPAWAESPDGIARRIARDMEVAAMMAHCGVHDHAARVLESALIVARAAGDPQDAAIERQLASVRDLARPNRRNADAFADHDVAPAVMVSAAGASTRTSRVPEPDATHAPPRSSSDAASSTPVDLGTADPYVMAAPAQIEPLPESHSFLNRLLPSRWGRRHEPSPEATRVVVNQPPVMVQPNIAPDIAPHYCPTCAAERSWSNEATVPQSALARDAVAVRRGPRIEAGPARPDKKIAADEPKAESAPGSGGFLTRMISKVRRSEPRSARSDAATAPPEVIEQPDEAPKLEPVNVARRPVELLTHETPDLSEPSITTAPKNVSTETATRPSVATSTPVARDRSTDGDKPAPVNLARRDADSSARESVDPVKQPSTVAGSLGSSVQISTTAASQIAVIGEVLKPGIFTVEGPSTAVSAALRHSGLKSSSIAQIRVFHSDATGGVEVHRLDLAAVADGSAASVQNQDLVIVDGTGSKPIYVAVMPHFVLQLPTKSDRRVTAGMIIEKLGAHWPELGERAIQVVRLSDTNGSNGSADSDLVASPLNGGDVFYVDGRGLDRSKAVVVAQEIANSAGAKIRTADAGSSNSLKK